jgi:threonine/homoserine/homoserine lactone efflux protein
MLRSILGFALFAVAVWLGLKVVFGLLGWVFGLAMWILWVAGIGFLIYLALRLVSPSTADKVRDTIRGKRGSTA